MNNLIAGHKFNQKNPLTIDEVRQVGEVEPKAVFLVIPAEVKNEIFKNKIKNCWLYIVNFDQHLGAAHSKRWLKFPCPGFFALF